MTELSKQQAVLAQGLAIAEALDPKVNVIKHSDLRKMRRSLRTSAAMASAAAVVAATLEAVRREHELLCAAHHIQQQTIERLRVRQPLSVGFQYPPSQNENGPTNQGRVYWNHQHLCNFWTVNDQVGDPINHGKIVVNRDALALHINLPVSRPFDSVDAMLDWIGNNLPTQVW